MSKRATEQESLYDDLDIKSSLELIRGINHEDQKVALAVQRELSSISTLIDVIVSKMQSGGRLFYIGAGTSGRLGILDASECPPTFGVSHDLVIGIIAGGDGAIRKAVEFAEDDTQLAWKDLSAYHISSNDVVIGIAASGTTPYVIGGLDQCQLNNIITGCICCNPDSPILKSSDYPICIAVGPEFLTGSTRMKSGTAQKMVLNMITTATMIRLGKVEGNKMIDMQLSNDKLVDRGTKMVQEYTGLSYREAKSLLLQHGSVRKAKDAFLKV